MSFAEMYESTLVAPLFAPWAEHLVEETRVGAGDRVLDVACGTGIVARLAQSRVGSNGRVVGVDLSPLMLEVARRVGPAIDWRESSAASLPVQDGELFDVVLCQQGLQFFPDRPVAVREMHRVLAPGGRVGLSVWRSDEEMPVLLELRRIAEQQIGPLADRRHCFGDAANLATLLASCGLSEVNVQAITKTIRFENGEDFIRLNALALVGMSAAAKDMNEADRANAMDAIVTDSRPVLEANPAFPSFAYEIGANVATARRN